MKYKLIIIAGVAILLGFAGGYFLKPDQISRTEVEPQTNNPLLSPYSGQETRTIKSLSQPEIEGLLAGEGTPFGGMAKLAELNGYPGPRHVLDMKDELGLTESQTNAVEKYFQEMKSEAVKLGTQIIDKEIQLNTDFANHKITEDRLKSGIDESANIYAALRFVHLKYHLATMGILNEDQIAKYNELRGYTGSTNPCNHVPDGHDPELWKMHNNCP